MNYTKLRTAVCAGSLLTLGGCGILETVDVQDIRFDSNTYIVQPGDTVQSVASRYNLDPNALASANSLDSSRLIPGQRLLLVRDGDFGSQVLASGRTAPDASQVIMVPAAGQTVPMTPVLTEPMPAEGTVVAVAPREQVVAVHEPSTDDLLDDSSPLFVSDLPAVPGGLPALPAAPGSLPRLPAASDSMVINDVRVDQVPVGNDQIARPEGIETVVQDVPSGTVLAENGSIPVAGSVPINDDISANSPVKRVTVNTRADGWNWPALGQITRDFDLREINRQGLDIDAGPGAGVQAAADGEVVYSGRDLASYGNLVILRHEDNFLSAYSKVSDIFVKENQKVKAGDLIAVVGDAQADSTELHFEIRRNGEPVNPVDYLPAL